MRVGSEYIHKKKRRKYVIDSVASIKVDGIWLPNCLVVYHRKGYPEPVYARFQEDFEESFEYCGS